MVRLLLTSTFTATVPWQALGQGSDALFPLLITALPLACRCSVYYMSTLQALLVLRRKLVAGQQVLEKGAQENWGTDIQGIS